MAVANKAGTSGELYLIEPLTRCLPLPFLGHAQCERRIEQDLCRSDCTSSEPIHPSVVGVRLVCGYYQHANQDRVDQRHRYNDM